MNVQMNNLIQNASQHLKVAETEKYHTEGRSALVQRDLKLHNLQLH